MARTEISRQRAILTGQDGIAMLTVLMLTIILTVIGIAAITSTVMDMKMAGGERLREVTVSAGEACMSSGVQIIQQTLANSGVPSTLTGLGANPVVTVNPLQAEVMGQSDGNLDSADPTATGNSPNAVLTLGGYTVTMDIDRLYAKPVSGGSAAAAAGYEGTGAAGSVQIMYRIDCYARNAAGATSHLSGLYSCVATGQSCQRKI